MNTLPILIRRELWEHRALWIVPLVVAALIVIAAMFPHASIHFDRSDITSHKQGAMFALFHSALTIPQFLVLSILVPFYLLDCLYAERKDRSILFWKALPVSDALTVLSKFMVALAIVPLGVYVLTILTDVAASGIIAVRFRQSDIPRSLLGWDTAIWLRTQAVILSALVLAMLWYAPLAAYLLLVSAWAKRNVILWATMPPLVAIILEKIAFGTTYVAIILGYRLNGIWGTLDLQNRLSGDTHAVRGPVTATMGPLRVLENPDLWLGLLLTVVLVWGTIRIRRHQDDT
jgi:ABC-2 type transport system permease protein